MLSVKFSEVVLLIQLKNVEEIVLQIICIKAYKVQCVVCLTGIVHTTHIQ